MADADTDDETIDVNVRLPRDWFNGEFLPLFPAAISRSEAVRMALQMFVEDSQELVASADVHNDVVESLEREGGSIENTLRIRIGDVEEVRVDNADSVSVNDESED